MKRAGAFLLLTTLAMAVGFLPDRRVPAPAQQPFTALARVTAHGGMGCGVLVGPDLLLTCSHCVASEERVIYNDLDVELGKGFYPVTKHARAIEFLKMTGRSDKPYEFSSGDDWAIVRLDRPLGLYFGWLNCRALSDNEWAKANIKLLGYCRCPEEANMQFVNMDKAYLCPGSVSPATPNTLQHDCSMWGGTSGAPLICEDEQGGYSIVALNFGGVDVVGEKLDHGFRAKYSKELANLAVPARRWLPQLSALTPAPNSHLRSFWVRNRSRSPIKVQARYQSIFQSPDEPALITEEKEVGWLKRLAIIKPTDGCISGEIYLSITDVQGNPLGPKTTLEQESNGKTLRFFKKSLGQSVEYTASFP